MKSYKEVYLMVNVLQKKAGADDVPIATQLLLSASDRLRYEHPVGSLNKFLGWGPNFSRTTRLNKNRDILSAMVRNLNRPIYGLHPEYRSVLRNTYNKALQYTKLPAPQVYKTPGPKLDDQGIANYDAVYKSPQNFRSTGIFEHLDNLLHNLN